MTLPGRAIVWQAATLAGLGLLLLWRSIDGSLGFYIHPRFFPLTGLAAVLLLILSQYLTARRPDEGQGRQAHWTMLILAIPLLISLLVPVRPLGAQSAIQRGIHLSSPPERLFNPLAGEIAPQQRNLLDWLDAWAQSPDAMLLSGQPVDVLGFAVLDPALPDGQFLLTRFGLTCCTADAFAVGMRVQVSGTLPEQDTWLQVRGTMDTLSLDGQDLPLIRASDLLPVSAPAEPYLLP